MIRFQFQYLIMRLTMKQFLFDSFIENNEYKVVGKLKNTDKIMNVVFGSVCIQE